MTLGYSPLSAIDRKIKACPQYDKFFDKPKNGKLTKKLLDPNGGVEETVGQMIAIVNKHYKEVDKAKHLVKGKTTHQTAKNIFDFLYKHIKYNLERGEILNSPAASYYLGQVKARQNPDDTDNWPVDCDDFSIFAASFLKSLGLPWAFRIASYNGTSYSHVYCVVPGKKEIIIDPVYYAFNKEKAYKKQKTYNGNSQNNLSGMNIHYQGINGLGLSGLGNTPMDNKIIELAGGVHFAGLGLGQVDDNTALLGYLNDTLKVVKHDPDIIRDTYQNPQQFIGMLEKDISGMNTKDEADILEILAKQESRMLSGLGGHSLNGVFSGDEDWYLDEEFTGYEPEEAGLEYHYQDGERYFTSLEGFFGRVGLFRKLRKKRISRKYNRLKKKNPSRAAKFMSRKKKQTKRIVKRRKILKNAARFFAKVSPVTIATRNSLRALLALNFLGVSSRLKGDKRAYSKVVDLYKKLGGKGSVIEKTIEKGSKRKPLKKKKGNVNVSGLEGFGAAVAISAILKVGGAILKKVFSWIKKRKEEKKLKELDSKTNVETDVETNTKSAATHATSAEPEKKTFFDKASNFVQDNFIKKEQVAIEPVNRDEGYSTTRSFVPTNTRAYTPPENTDRSYIPGDKPETKNDKIKKYGIIAGLAAVAIGGAAYIFNRSKAQTRTIKKPRKLEGVKLR